MIDLDVHAHLIPIDSDALTGLDGIVWDESGQSLTVDGKKLRMARLFDPTALLAWMTEHQVARAYISVPPPTYRQHLTAEAARPWAAYVNDGLLAIATLYQNRLTPLLHLPVEHPSVAVDLATRYRQAHKAGYALAAGGKPEILYSDPDLDPLWAELNRQGSFVFLHPGHCCDPRLSPFYLENLVGNPYETALAATHLICRDIPRTYPGIRFCLAHGGGMFPAIAGRLQKGFETERPGMDLSIEPPIKAARRFYCDCITHDDGALAQAAHVFGEDHIHFGSDWPFPMGISKPDR